MCDYGKLSAAKYDAKLLWLQVQQTLMPTTIWVQLIQTASNMLITNANFRMA